MADEEVIQQEMEHTRQALAEKLETLERKVAGTVEDVTDSVRETVETVTDTVQQTVETVSGAVETVTGAVEGTVESVTESVKNIFDIPGHVRRHPWAMMGGSVAVGFLAGRLLGGRSEPAAAAPELPAPPAPAPVRHRNGRGHHPRMARPAREANGKHDEEQPGFFSRLLDRFGSEIGTLKGLALGTTVGVVRDMLVQALPESLKQEVSNFMNDLTGTLGGRPIREPILGEDTDAVSRQRIPAR